MKPWIMRLHERGYRQLVSIIPPGAPLAPGSRLPRSQLGKIPGIRLPNGTWRGYDWLKPPNDADVQKWGQDGASVGMLGAYYPGLDIDVTVEWLAELIEHVAVEQLGAAPRRIGRAPKRLLMYRTGEPFPRLAAVLTYDGQRHLVEVLGQGKQYVIEGPHPSGSRYTWNEDLLERDPDSLTWIDQAKIGQFFDALRERVEPLDVTVELVGAASAKQRANVAQADLLAPSTEALRECVAAIPNTDELFPDRPAYIKMGEAIHAAAGPEHEAEGFEVYADWAARHEKDERVAGNPETWRRDWAGFASPHSVGWSWLSELASQYGFNAARHEFDAVEAVRAERDNRPPKHSDAWLADLVVQEHGERLRYVPALNRWYVWDGWRWVPDSILSIEHLIDFTLRAESARVARQGATEKEKRAAQALAMRLSSAYTQDAVRRKLKADPRLTTTIDVFDADPMLLNTPGGIVDLRTGELRPPDPAALCSRSTLVAPDFTMPTPVWDKFLREATGGDIELQMYLRRAIGYALTGKTSEQVFLFIHGPTGTGKGTFLNNVWFLIFHNYVEKAPTETFLSSKFGSGHPTDLAGLAGARLVVAAETDDGRRWNEQRLKELVGGDPVRARFMRQDFFTFQPLFLLIVMSNYKPEIRNLDDAIRRRMHLVPFKHQPAERDNELPAKLRAEFPGILAWGIRGCLEWQEHGLQPPQAVVAASEEYFREEDPVATWIEQECESDPEAFTTTLDLFQSWQQWANAHNEFDGTPKRLSQILAAKNYVRADDPKTRRHGFRGLLLCNPVELL